MKKVESFLLIVIMVIMCIIPLNVFAATGVQAPVLKQISFNNAVVVEKYSPDIFEYSLELDDSNVNPTLKDYVISDGSKLFVTKIMDDTGHQVGVNVEVKSGALSTNYVFNYIKNENMKITSDNNLASFECELGEIKPALNEKTSEYTLYVPSDLTELKLSAQARDVSAVCVVPESIKLNPDQTIQVEVVVTASDTSTKVYTFNVKRINKTCEEVQKLMDDDGIKSILKGEFFYQKPLFYVIVSAPIVVLILLFVIIKRVKIKAYDNDEIEFFDYFDKTED